jgi:hypothetical protein
MLNVENNNIKNANFLFFSFAAKVMPSNNHGNQQAVCMALVNLRISFNFNEHEIIKVE